MPGIWYKISLSEKKEKLRFLQYFFNWKIENGLKLCFQKTQSLQYIVTLPDTIETHTYVISFQQERCLLGAQTLFWQIQSLSLSGSNLKLGGSGICAEIKGKFESSLKRRRQMYKWGHVCWLRIMTLNKCQCVARVSHHMRMRMFAHTQ